MDEQAAGSGKPPGKRGAKPCRLCGKTHWEVFEDVPGSSVWYARVWHKGLAGCPSCTRRPQGHPKKEMVGTHGLALKRATQMKAEVAEGRFFPKAVPPWDPTFADYLDDYLARNESQLIDVDGQRRFATYMKHAPEFAGKTMRQLERPDAERYRERRRKEGAPGAKRRRGAGSVRTVNKELSFCRAVFNDFLGQLEDRKLSTIANPFASSRRRKLYAPEPPGRTRHLGSQGDDEADRLFAALPDVLAKAKVAAAILTGIDRGPMFAWTWKEDIDFAGNQVRGWRQKGKGELRVYWVPMVPELRQLLLALPSRDTSKWVWPNAMNTAHDDGREFVRTVFKPALVKAGILTRIETTETTQVRCMLWKGRKQVPGVRTVEKKHWRIEGSFRWKDLRHTFASWLRRKGVELGIIGAVLGHRPGSRQTNVYAHLTPDMTHDAVRSLTGFLPTLSTTDRPTDRRPGTPDPTVH